MCINTKLCDTGSYIHNYGNVAAVYTQNSTITSITIPAGMYLIIGHVDANAGVNLMAAAITCDKSSATYILPSTRTVGDAGGGVATVGFCKAVESTTLTLLSYGYQNSTYNLKGHLIAIKLSN